MLSKHKVKKKPEQKLFQLIYKTDFSAYFFHPKRIYCIYLLKNIYIINLYMCVYNLSTYIFFMDPYLGDIVKCVWFTYFIISKNV